VSLYNWLRQFIGSRVITHCSFPLDYCAYLPQKYRKDFSRDCGVLLDVAFEEVHWFDTRRGVFICQYVALAVGSESDSLVFNENVYIEVYNEEKTKWESWRFGVSAN
jgi:hypothetical protein